MGVASIVSHLYTTLHPRSRCLPKSDKSEIVLCLKESSEEPRMPTKQEKEVDQVVVPGTCTWEIRDFSKLKAVDKFYSQEFDVAGHKWWIIIKPKGTEVNLVTHLSIYLSVDANSRRSSGWSICANVSLTVVNQFDANKSISSPARGAVRQVFSEHQNLWGVIAFMPLNKLYDGSGYLVNDICIVQAKIDVVHVPIMIDVPSVVQAPCKIENQGNDTHTVGESTKLPIKLQGPSNLNSVQLDPASSAAPEGPCSETLPSFQATSTLGSDQVGIKLNHGTGDVPSLVREMEDVHTVDFRKLGIEESFVPLLEEVCKWYPSLIESQQNKSKMFKQCGFTALGRILHFLQTIAVKDMTQDASAQLRLYWQELQVFKFGLDWLEPHVHSALDKKKFVERAGRVKGLKKDVKCLENETKRRKAMLTVIELDLQLAKRDLALAEEGFNELELDSKLGYKRC